MSTLNDGTNNGTNDAYGAADGAHGTGGTGGAGGAADGGRVREYPRQRSPKKERSDILATAFALVVGFAVLILHVFRYWPDKGAVPGKIGRVAGEASVMDGTAVARDAIGDGAANMLWAGHWTAVALLALLVLFGAMLTRNFLRGDFFTRGSYRWLTVLTWVLFAYLLMPGLLGMMGGNWAMADMGIEGQGIPPFDAPEFIVIYVVLMILSLAIVAIRRAGVLERDVEGLV